MKEFFTCTICHVGKVKADFYGHAHCRDGITKQCKECLRHRALVRYTEKKDQILERRKVSRNDETRAKESKRRREWERRKRMESPEWFKERGRIKVAKKRGSRPLVRMANACRNRIGYAMKVKRIKKCSPTADILGCDWETLAAHLESRFLPGMTWQNYGKWHIDHIIPLASAESENGLVSLCHYTNTQPLWAIDNIRKGASIPVMENSHLPAGLHHRNC